MARNRDFFRNEMIEGKLNVWVSIYRLVCCCPPWGSQYPIYGERWQRMRMLAAWAVDGKIHTEDSLVLHGMVITCDGVKFEEPWACFPSEKTTLALMLRCGDA